MASLGGRPEDELPGPPPPTRELLAGRARFDGTFVGPMRPPPQLPHRPGPPPPPAPTTAPGTTLVSEAVLAIPLGTKELVRQALDLLTRRDAGLRGASFYIGFMLLVTCAPVAIVLGLALTVPNLAVMFDPYAAYTGAYEQVEAWPAWILLAAIPAVLGYLGAATEARSLATAVIGGRLEGRPLRLRESIAVARARFWTMLGAMFLLGVVASVASIAVQLVVLMVTDSGGELSFGVSLVVSVLVGAPFVYVPAGIVLGEVGAIEAITRSIRLVRLRKRLAVVVTLFGVLSQFIVLFGLSTGIDVIARLVIGAGLVESFPAALAVPIAAALVFAMGTLFFLVEGIAAAPAVHAFAALTHYTRGLELGRVTPVTGARLWNPWLTPGLAICAIVALLALLGAVLTLPA